MPTEPATTAKPPGPPTEGLPQGGRLGGDDPRPSPARDGDTLIDAAGAGAKLSAGEQEDLLDYFLANGSLPGDDKPVPVEWTIGTGAKARKQVWHVRRINWDERQDAIERATDEKTGEFDAYKSSSWIVARALVEPKLGPRVIAQQEEASASADHKITGPNGSRIEPASDAAHLLRRMFASQAGVLIELSGEVLRISKLQNSNESTRTLDEEVEAGKA